MMVEATCMLLMSVSVLLWYLRTTFGYWTGRGVPTEEPSFPYGNMRGVYKTKHILDVLNPLYKKYKTTAPFAGIYMMLNPVAVVMDLAVIRCILIKEFENFEDRGMYHNDRQDPVSAHLFRVDGPQWRPLRMKFQTTFTQERMRTFFPKICIVGREFVRVVETLSDSAAVNVLEITNLMSRYTCDVIGKCILGIEINALRNPSADYYHMARRAFHNRRHSRIVDGFMATFPDLARRLRMKQMQEDISEFYLRVVREIVEERERLRIKKDDYMNIMIEMKRAYILTVEQIAAQVFTFFSSGFDTSANTMGFALYELAKQPRLQARLRAEIEGTLALHNGELTYECMQEMRLMEMTIAETLRLYPVLPYITRVTKNFFFARREPKWYFEPGQIVVIPIYAIQHDPDLYPDPESFKPERFTPEELARRPLAAWLPFGDGSRNCIGMRFGKMQIFIGLTYLLRRFHFSICDGSPSRIRFDKEKDLLSSASGIHLRVQKLRQ